MAPLLAEWLELFRCDPPVTTGNIARHNLRRFSATMAERASLRVEDVVELLHASAALWRTSLAGRTGWLFYAWHDAQAGQLRVCAFPAREIGELPFACRLRRAEASDVARDFLTGHDTICWDELIPTAVDEVEEPSDVAAYVLSVWAVEIGM